MIALDEGLADVSWADRLDLFRWTLAAALVAGVACPLAGTFLHLRRTSFQGIALPQFATAGIVCGFVVLPWWVANVGLGGVTLDEALADTHAAMNYHLAWAALFTLGGLFALAWAGRRRVGSEVGRVAAGFALANAATYLFGRFSPIGKGHADELLSGEVLGVGFHEFETLLVVLGLALALLFWFRRDFVLASYDRETALVLGRPVARIEVLLSVVVGLVVAVGTMTLGPTLLFGLLVLPPIAARLVARSLASLFLVAAAAGVVAVILGTVASFELDLPLGPAIVAAAGACLGALWIAARARG